jgi:hypothetical protein
VLVRKSRGEQRSAFGHRDGAVCREACDVTADLCTATRRRRRIRHACSERVFPPNLLEFQLKPTPRVLSVRSNTLTV